jgi:hypothetical protein
VRRPGVGTRRRRVNDYECVVTRSIFLVAVSSFVLSACGLGGPSGPSGPPPDAQSEEIVELRRDGTRAADRALVNAAKMLGGEMLGRASNDRCWEGQRNYKVDEGYDYRCSILRALVVGFGGDFRSRIARFDQRLFASGWECDPYFECESNSQLVEEYWDLRSAERLKGQPFPIWRLPTKGDGYARGDVRLYVEYASTVAGSTYWLETASFMSRSGLRRFYEDERPLDVQAVLAAGRRYPYLVVLSTEIDYFTEE